MPLLDILVAPHPALKTKARPVAKVTPGLIGFMDDMLATMYAAPGIGLAANQVGDLRRVIVADCAQDGETDPYYLINPEIISTSQDRESLHEEGCLSLPDLYAGVTRPAVVRITYLDKTGKRQELEADGLLSTCIQHEIDHLNGILFIDHLSALKRNMMMRKLKKWTKENGKTAILEHPDPKARVVPEPPSPVAKT